MGRLVAIEGLDGGGKTTFSQALTDVLTARGCKVGHFKFPRYGEGVHAELITAALHGRLGSLVESAHGMAVLFALDRFTVQDKLQHDLDQYDVILVDRYIASNAAFQAARLDQDAAGEFVHWVYQFEVENLHILAPDLHILVDISVNTASARIAHREQTGVNRDRDRYEADIALQTRCRAVYQGLAAASWLSPWIVVDGELRANPATIAEQILAINGDTVS